MDLALGRCCFLTGSVSRCWDSSCGRKDAHPVFPGLELLFWLFLFPLCSVNVQLMGGGYDAWWHIGVGGWRRIKTGRPGRGVHCWRQGRERGAGGTEGRWLLGWRGLCAAGKVLEAWTAMGGFIPLWSGQRKKGDVSSWYEILIQALAAQLHYKNSGLCSALNYAFPFLLGGHVKQRKSQCICGQRAPCWRSGSDPGSLEPLHFGNGEPASKSRFTPK